MIPRYLTDARHGISSLAILKFQSGSLFLYHKASHLSDENFMPSCIAIVLIYFSAVVICLYNIILSYGAPMDCQIISVGDHLYFATQVQL